MRSREARPGGRAGGVKRLVAAVLVLVLMLALGFVLFARSVAAVRPIEGARADGIVVLTGGELRLKEAMRLLAEKRGTRLLVSGAFRRTTREELRRVTGQPEALFECCVDLGYSAHDTIGNADETRRWAGHWQFRTLLVVTSGYHIPRAMAELRRELPDHTLIAHPVRPPTLQLDAWWRHPATLRTLAVEYMKFVPAQTRSWLVRLWRSVRGASAEVRSSGWIGSSA